MAPTTPNPCAVGYGRAKLLLLGAATVLVFFVVIPSGLWDDYTRGRLTPLSFALWMALPVAGAYLLYFVWSKMWGRAAVVADGDGIQAGRLAGDFRVPWSDIDDVQVELHGLRQVAVVRLREGSDYMAGLSRFSRLGLRLATAGLPGPVLVISPRFLDRPAFAIVDTLLRCRPTAQRTGTG